MARDLAEFHDLVSAEINKGTAFDSVIPDYVRRTVKWLEKNYNFKYMEVVDSTNYTITTGDYSYPQPARLKSVELWRYMIETDPTVANAGRWKAITKVDAADLGGRVTKAPATFYMNARDTLELGEIPGEDYDTAELRYWRFTDWPETETTTATMTVTDADAATVSAVSITFRSLVVTGSAVVGANGAALATALQTVLRAADGGSTAISVTWATNVLTITDTSGRVISGWSFTGFAGTATYTEIPWLVTDGEDLLLAATIVKMGNRLRDNDLVNQYKQQRDEELRTTSISEEDLDAGAEDNEMQYADIGHNEEYLSTLGDN